MSKLLLGPLFSAWIKMMGIPNDVTDTMRAHPDYEWLITGHAWARGVPPALLMVIGIFETRLGSDVPNEGAFGIHASSVHGFCTHLEFHPGIVCPTDPFEAQVEAAAEVLRVGRTRCGSWRGAATYLRTGQCTIEKDHTNYGVRARTLARHLDPYGHWDEDFLAWPTLGEWMLCWLAPSGSGTMGNQEIAP